MKKITLIAAILFSCIFLDSCKKYPEGPMLSFRTRTARVANTWKVGSCTINGTDFTSTYTNMNYSETYEKKRADLKEMPVSG